MGLVIMLLMVTMASRGNRRREHLGMRGGVTRVVALGLINVALTLVGILRVRRKVILV